MPLSRHSMGTFPENELTRNLSGSTRPQSFQIAEPPWTDPGTKSGIRVRELISTSKKKEKKKGTGGERVVEHFPLTLASEENSTMTDTHWVDKTTTTTTTKTKTKKHPDF